MPFHKYSLSNANASLDASPYKFEADGVTPWDASKATADGEYFRHTAEGEKLVVKHKGTDDNTVTDAVENQFNATEDTVVHLDTCWIPST